MEREQKKEEEKGGWGEEEDSNMSLHVQMSGKGNTFSAFSQTKKSCCPWATGQSWFLLLWFVFKKKICYVGQEDLELMKLSSQSPEYWNYKQVLWSPTYTHGCKPNLVYACSFFSQNTMESYKDLMWLWMVHPLRNCIYHEKPLCRQLKFSLKLHQYKQNTRDKGNMNSRY